MRRFITASLLGVLLTASTASAADEPQATPSLGSAVSAAAAALATAPMATTAEENAEFVRRWSASHDRPALLPALYGTSIALQGYDAYSTLTVLKQGGVEANPVMKGITKSPAAFIGLKAGVTMMSIMAAERMWKRHNRVGAIVTMVASNSLMAMVAANNAKVLSSLR